MVLTLKRKYFKQIKKSPYNKKAHFKDSLFSVGVKQASRSDLSERLAFEVAFIAGAIPAAMPPQDQVSLPLWQDRCQKSSQ